MGQPLFRLPLPACSLTGRCSLTWSVIQRGVVHFQLSDVLPQAHTSWWPAIETNLALPAFQMGKCLTESLRQLGLFSAALGFPWPESQVISWKNVPRNSLFQAIEVAVFTSAQQPLCFCATFCIQRGHGLSGSTLLPGQCC